MLLRHAEIAVRGRRSSVSKRRGELLRENLFFFLTFALTRTRGICDLVRVVIVHSYGRSSNPREARATLSYCVMRERCLKVATQRANVSLVAKTFGTCTHGRGGEVEVTPVFLLCAFTAVGQLSGC